MSDDNNNKELLADKEKLYFDLPNNIYLGIKYDRILFLTPSKKELILSFSHYDIDKTSVYPACIKFTFKKYDMDFRFNTSSGYEIS